MIASPRRLSISPLWLDAIRRGISDHKAVAFLFSLALLTRLPLLSGSLDEIDSANFVNALTNGYEIAEYRPHAPGYPVYIFAGWLMNGVVGDPKLSLTLLSALLGSLAVIPFYLLLREFGGSALAVIGSLLFLVNPLFWSFSEAALSDVPSVFFAVSLGWLCYKGRYSDRALLWAFIVISLAIGVRFPNVALLALLAFPMGYRALKLRNAPWKLLVLGTGLFLITTMAWAIPMVAIGSGGPASYIDATSDQWSGAVRAFDITHVESPQFLNGLFRTERFLFGYFLTYPWSGDDSRTLITTLIVIPWLFGLALFVTGFNLRNPQHVFVAIWIVTIAFLIATIHFLPRYGLAQLPAFIFGCFFGYQFLAGRLFKHPRSVEILCLVGIGCILILLGIKHQPPVGAFEGSPPSASYIGGLIFTAGVVTLLVAKFAFHRWQPAPRQLIESFGVALDTAVPRRSRRLLAGGLALLIIPFGIHGYQVASTAHDTPSPGQQLVDFIETNFETFQVTPCWDNQTHGLFQVLTREVQLDNQRSIDELYEAHSSGRTLLVTNLCPWYDEIDRDIGLTKVISFEATSPLWSKTPSIHLYATNPNE